VLALDEAQQRAVQSSILQSALITLLVTIALVSVLLAMIIQNAIISPLRHLGQAARRIARGELGARVPVNSTDEVGELGRSFNHMAARIERRSRQLDELNRTLEARVQARTAEVQQQAAWLEAILCSAQEAILVTDSQQVVTLINDAALKVLDITRQEALGIQLQKLIRRATGQIVVLPMDGDKARQGELEIHQQHYHYSLSPLRAPHAQHQGCILALTDITPLRRLDNLKTHVIRMAAHDLRSPIGSLRIQNHLLKKTAQMPAQRQGEMLKRIDSTLDTLEQMVNDLLDVEHIERQAHGFQETVMKESLLKSALSVLASDIEVRKHHITLGIAADLPFVCGDPVQLLEVIRNLLTNAIKYTPPEGKLSVCAYLDEDRLCVEFSDNGIGIEPDDLQRIFEPHFRARGALDEPGNGIGLSLVRDTIEQHGGQVWAHSQPGMGSTFGFNLPVARSCASDSR
jgi:signal transduction histidine kinase